MVEGAPCQISEKRKNALFANFPRHNMVVWFSTEEAADKAFGRLPDFKEQAVSAAVLESSV